MSLRSIAFCASLSAFVAVTGCSHATSAANTGTPRPATVIRDRNVITQAELQDPEIRDLTISEVVQRLRPNYLVSRGPTTIRDSVAIAENNERLESGKVHASIDGISIVGLEYLRTIYARSVVEIRLLPSGPAMQQFGPRAYGGPVILVRMN